MFDTHLDREHGRGWANVRSFGAKLDGVTDDTAAISRMLENAPDGATIIFPRGTCIVTPGPIVGYHDKGAPNGNRRTAFHVIGRKNLTIRGVGGVNIIVAGTDSERVAFFFDGCTNVRVEGFGFNLDDTDTSGAAQLPSQDFYPIALEGNDGIAITRCRFVAARTAIFADAYNGARNTNIRVDGCTFKNTVHYSLLVRNADGVAFVNNRCTGTGRNWNTSNEDVGLSDNTVNSTVSANQFIDPIGTVSRITAVLNLGPTSIVGNVKNGPGIFVEIYESSNITISGNASTDNVGTSEHVLFTSNTNTNNEHVSITGNTFVGGGHVVSDFFAGANTKDGLIFLGNICSGTYGPQTSSPRTGVVFQGNRFDLADAGQEIRSAGLGLIFEGNEVRNGYLSLLDGNSARVQGNYFLGNFGVPIAVALNISGTTGHDVRGNRFEPGSYTAYWSQVPAAPIGFHYLDIGLSQNPAAAMPALITGAIGDTVINDTPVAGGPPGWVCTAAGTPGVWKGMANLSP